MSRSLISIIVALGILSSVAIALTVKPNGAHPSKADLDWTFAQFVTVSLDPESAATDREKIRMAGLKRMNLGQFSE
jgi:hypothetical protein